MDVAVDLYVAVPLLFTVLAVILASVFVKLRSSEEDKATEPAAKEEGEAKASVAAVDRTGGEALQKDEREPEAAGAEPRKGRGGEEEEEEAAISREDGRDAVEEIGAEEEGTNEEKEEGKREKGRREEEVEEEAAPEAVKAEQRSHVQVERKVPGQAERDAVVAAPVALEEQEEDEEEEEEEEDEEEEESKEEDQESENEKLVVKEPETKDADEKFSFKYSPGKLRGNQYQTMMTKEELEEEQRVQREQLAAIFTLLKEKSDTFGDMSESDIKEQLKLYDI